MIEVGGIGVGRDGVGSTTTDTCVKMILDLVFEPYVAAIGKAVHNVQIFIDVNQAATNRAVSVHGKFHLELPNGGAERKEAIDLQIVVYVDRHRGLTQKAVNRGSLADFVGGIVGGKHCKKRGE